MRADQFIDLIAFRDIFERYYSSRSLRFEKPDCQSAKDVIPAPRIRATLPQIYKCDSEVLPQAIDDIDLYRVKIAKISEFLNLL